MQSTTKICSKCGVEKSFSEFRDGKGRGRKHTYCRVCHQEYDKQYYKNKPRSKDQKRRACRNFYHLRKKWIAAIKRQSGCLLCPEDDPRCLDFHHRDPKSKKFSIANNVRAGKKAIISEMAKCDVLCSNCHRKQHSTEVD